MVTANGTMPQKPKDWPSSTTAAIKISPESMKAHHSRISDAPPARNRARMSSAGRRRMSG